MSKAFVEAPLEMLYYSDDINDIVEGNKDMWKWKTILTISYFIDDQLFQEGTCAQIMHKGNMSQILTILKNFITHFFLKQFNSSWIIP